MKHIKQKYQSEKEIPGLTDWIEQSGQKISPKELANIKVPKNLKAFLFTEKGTSIASFIHKIDEKHFLIPEPEPVLIYFNNAQTNFRFITESRRELIQRLDLSKGSESSNNIRKALFDYMFHVTGFIIFLFTAIETMINKTIPPTFVYREDKGKWTQEYNFGQIQRELAFDTKINKVLVEVTKRSFAKSHPTVWNSIVNLKNFRDDIIHTKKDTDIHTPYSYIFKQAINFNYSKTILAVRDLINFYHPNLVEECDCGQDF